MEQTLLEEIEAFIKDTGMSMSKFGESAVHSTAFIQTLRGGRNPRASTVAKVRAFISDFPEFQMKQDIKAVEAIQTRFAGRVRVHNGTAYTSDRCAPLGSAVLRRMIENKWLVPADDVLIEGVLSQTYFVAENIDALMESKRQDIEVSRAAAGDT